MINLSMNSSICRMPMAVVMPLSNCSLLLVASLGSTIIFDEPPSRWCPYLAALFTVVSSTSCMFWFGNQAGFTMTPNLQATSTNNHRVICSDTSSMVAENATPTEHGGEDILQRGGAFQRTISHHYPATTNVSVGILLTLETTTAERWDESRLIIGNLPGNLPAITTQATTNPVRSKSSSGLGRVLRQGNSTQTSQVMKLWKENICWSLLPGCHWCSLLPQPAASISKQMQPQKDLNTSTLDLIAGHHRCWKKRRSSRALVSVQSSVHNIT